MPRMPIIKDKDTLNVILNKKINFPPINDLYVSLEELSEEQLERMSVEYDAFNKYRHGDISLKFLKSFNVSIPIQEEGFARWVQKNER